MIIPVAHCILNETRHYIAENLGTIEDLVVSKCKQSTFISDGRK